MLFLPVGGGPTIGLERPDDFLAALGTPVSRLDTSDANAEALLGTTSEPTVALFAPPA